MLHLICFTLFLLDTAYSHGACLGTIFLAFWRVALKSFIFKLAPLKVQNIGVYYTETHLQATCFNWVVFSIEMALKFCT